jgi:prepilin signal peptidase PulO-like enzyme (type II secretory pathway)
MPLQLFFLTFLGLMVGSFLAAFSFRLPKNISVARGRSFCPHCKKQIAWYDNIPLLSFLILLGRCRNCKKNISLRYPLIELATGLGFFFISLNYYPNVFLMIFNLLIYSLLVLIFVIDLEHQIIPDSLIFFGILVFTLYLIISNQPHFFQPIFAGLLAALFLMILHLITRGRGMGLGDVKFAVLGGMITGLNLMPVWLFASFLTGGLAGIILILAGKAGLKTKVAFGPFLVIGLLLTLIWGEKLMLLLW